jgi:GlpG protein|tara:strand:+ start:1224 stop:1895 length:672 start_codon:yes stop_codon:yes gene_type:complete
MTGDRNTTSQLDSRSLSLQLRSAPVVMIVLLLSILGAAVVEWLPLLVHWFTIQDYSLDNNTIIFSSISSSIDNAEYWRFVTPIFLHFGHFHLIFNALLFWILGEKIEYFLGSPRLFVYITLIAISSNIAQYLLGVAALFGGLSGVVYGLLGFIWIRQKISPTSVLTVPQGLAAFMFIWLILGISGIVDFFMDASIANAAHAMGLIGGVILGVFDGRDRPSHLQ